MTLTTDKGALLMGMTTCDWTAAAALPVHPLGSETTDEERAAGVLLRSSLGEIFAITLDRSSSGKGATAAEALADLRSYLETGYTAWGNDAPREERVREAIASRRWLATVIDVGQQHPRIIQRVWTAGVLPEVVRHLGGAPVAAYDHLGHLPPAELSRLGRPDPRNVIGHVVEARQFGDRVAAEVHIHAAAIHETLVRAYFAGDLSRVLGLSVVARTLSEPRLVYRRNALGVRVSEGVRDVITSVVGVVAVDLVSAPHAGGRLDGPLGPDGRVV